MTLRTASEKPDASVAPKKSGTLTSTLTEATFSPQRAGWALSQDVLCGLKAAAARGGATWRHLYLHVYSGARDMEGVDEAKAGTLLVVLEGALADAENVPSSIARTLLVFFAVGEVVGEGEWR